MAFGSSFSRAFEATLPLGFKAGEQQLREELLQKQLDEANYQQQTREKVQEAGAAARAAPIYESAPTTAPNAQGVLETSNAPAPVRPEKARPMWLDRDAMYAQGQMLIDRGQYEQGARMQALADQQFDRGMKQVSDNMLRALEAQDYDTAFKLYDTAVPDGMRIQDWKIDKSGAITANLIGADGKPVPWKGNKDELRALAIGLTDPAKIQDIRDNALDREAKLWMAGVGAALQGNKELARKLLGGDVTITETKNAEGVKDQLVTLPDGRQMLRSQIEKVAPWAMQEQGMKLKKAESDLETAGVERGLKAEQAKTEGARRNQLNAYADYLRGKGLGAAAGKGATMQPYEEVRKSFAPIFENFVGKNFSGDQATDLATDIVISSRYAQARGFPGSQMPESALIRAIRSDDPANVRLDQRATLAGPDGTKHPMPVWRVTDPQSGTVYTIPAYGIRPDTSPPPTPTPQSSGTGLAGRVFQSTPGFAPPDAETGPLPPPAASPSQMWGDVKRGARGLWDLMNTP